MGIYAIASAQMVNSFHIIKQKFVDYLSDSETWVNLFFIGLQIIFIYIASRIVLRVVKKTIKHMTSERVSNPLKFDSRRTSTIGRLVLNVSKSIINFITILLILQQLGFNLLPLLAGAGVVGLAIGFGAQSLVKDLITGFFIIFEDQFAVGDVIKVGAVTGTVLEIGIRTTTIKVWTGEVHIFPNGTINQVTNYSVHNSIAVVDISVAYEADIEMAIKVIKETADRVYATNANVISEPNVLGVQALSASDVVIRVTAECLPMTHFSVGRQLNAELKKSLDERKIEIPYPRLVTYQRTEKIE